MFQKNTRRNKEYGCLKLLTHTEDSETVSTMSSGAGPILEDDQQLYDWGIENRLDQYYQDTDPSGEAYTGAGGGQTAQAGGSYYTRSYGDRRHASDYPGPGDRSSAPDYTSPPPAHQEAGYSHGQGRIKEEPGVDMSGWNFPYSR